MKRRDFLKWVGVGLAALVSGWWINLVACGESKQKTFFPTLTQAEPQGGQEFFSDFFDRPDGPIGGGWIGSTWSIGGGKAVNATPAAGAEMFKNPGAEGTYVSGLAPNWTKNGVEGTWSEEGTIIHGGSKAQKFVGGAITDCGIFPDYVTITSGQCYLFSAWFRSDGPGSVSVRRIEGRLKNIAEFLGYDTKGAYRHVTIVDRATSTGVESVMAVQNGITSQTIYADDFSLKPLSNYAALFCTRQVYTNQIIIAATPIYSGVGQVGIALLDGPNQPSNYAIAFWNGTHLILSKYVNQVETRLITGSVYWVDNGTLEIRQNGPTLQLFYRGMQVGTDQTVTEVQNNHYVGMYSVDGGEGNSFSSFYTRGLSSIRTVPAISNPFAGKTYPAGKGVVSLRFDDGPAIDYTLVFPLLAARGLVGGFALPANAVNKTASDLSLEQIKMMQSAGMEFMCHSLTHSSDPANLAGFKDETITALAEERILGINAVSFVQPGTWVGDYAFNSTAFLGSPGDQILRSYFACYEAYIVPFDSSTGLGRYNLPRSSIYGVEHIAGENPLPELEKWIDQLISEGRGGEVCFHSITLGMGSPHLSVAEFTMFLDYIQTKLASGELVCLTPTQQLFATQKAV